MEPTLWGPSIWQMLFSCAWMCAPVHFETLRIMVMEQIPLLLPCSQCRQNFGRHLDRINKRARGEPRNSEHMFRWLWYLKDEVNRNLGRTSIPLAHVVDRYVLHGGIIDDVALGDTLVLLSLSARSYNRDDVFIAFCNSLHILLPLPHDSEFIRHIVNVQRPIVTTTVRVACAARVERGIKPLVLAHYKAATE